MYFVTIGAFNPKKPVTTRVVEDDAWLDLAETQAP